MRSVGVLVAVLVLFSCFVRPKADTNNDDLPSSAVRPFLQDVVFNFTRQIDAISATYCDPVGGSVYWDLTTGAPQPYCD